ncbi:energy-coupling factor transporter transmembrane component T [Kaistia dalseonensis]|uniref:Energy-coupling factor transport system permease protein n=1 Tax=Kaistia dalseonensis TaxID=410840 RepID=A0ABU0HAG9_9HYPH|nr:energy-coupling factor transporter transmembrane component T [Kaistia dalseonensis]MCX5496682.1 energy-coupling factor transporter transmembrane component T [Kaistia dalseonensis]MDQ0439307.1 energy-coupling factor transport system permease protein [Kaistia dalseonensis]
MSSRSGPQSGQTALLFLPGDSLLHRANPLTSLIFMLWMISAAAVLPTIGTTILIVAGVALSFAMGVGPRVTKRLVITMLPLLVALLVVHGFLVSRPDFIPLVGPLTYSPTGLEYAAQVVTRIGAMLTASLIFVTTTHPGDILKSLDQRGVSPGVSYLIASPLLLIEPFSERAKAIRDAQRARGLDLTSTFKARFKALPALLIPLITLALSDLDHRASILNSRAFRAQKHRTVIDAPPDDRFQVWLRRVLIVLAIAQLGIPLLWR